MGGPEGATAGGRARDDAAVAEYVESRDAQARGWTRQPVALHVPFYHHDTRESHHAATAVLESRPAARAKRVTELLAYLGAAGVVSGTQFAKESRGKRGGAQGARAGHAGRAGDLRAARVGPWPTATAGGAWKDARSFRVGGDASHARRMDDGGASAAERDAGQTSEAGLTERARASRARAADARAGTSCDWTARRISAAGARARASRARALAAREGGESPAARERRRSRARARPSS